MVAQKLGFDQTMALFQADEAFALVAIDAVSIRMPPQKLTNQMR